MRSEKLVRLQFAKKMRGPGQNVRASTDDSSYWAENRMTSPALDDTRHSVFTLGPFGLESSLMDRSNEPATPGTDFTVVRVSFERIGSVRKNTSPPSAVSVTNVAKKTSSFRRGTLIALLPFRPRGLVSRNTETMIGACGSVRS